MTLMNGKEVSTRIRENLKEKTLILKKAGINPTLAVILIGNDTASKTYVSMKEKACISVGISSTMYALPENTKENELLSLINTLNNDDNIDGILVQLPLPKHINTNLILENVVPNKDVDGFHAYNVGRLVENMDGFVPCTPLGVMKLLEEYNINPSGMNACVIGRSNIVGKPMLSLLLNAGATVTICHSKTKDLSFHTLNSDLIVVGVGKPNLITSEMIKEGAIVIDVGINRLENGKLTGDVDFENVGKKCSFITPVPGGVGPMTIAMLLSNTIKSASLKLKNNS